MTNRDLQEILDRVDNYINLELISLSMQLDVENLRKDVLEVAKHQYTIIPDLEVFKETMKQKRKEYVILSQNKKITI